jgi:hypothetical protein
VPDGRVGAVREAVATSAGPSQMESQPSLDGLRLSHPQEHANWPRRILPLPTRPVAQLHGVGDLVKLQNQQAARFKVPK